MRLPAAWKNLWAVVFVELATAGAAAGPASAHEGGEAIGRSPLMTWEITPDIAIPTVLVAAVYLSGLFRRRAAGATLAWWRPLLFFSGMAAVFLALQSPLDALADRLFSVHQVQHLFLRMLGPMLIALSWPEGVLTAGLPAPVRRMALAPVVTNGLVRGIFGFLARPTPATLMFIAALYVWQIPRYHDIALLNESVHYAMHLTMLFAGLVFWQRIFDRRAPPHGLGYGTRMMMLWIVILSNIVLGAYTALKGTVLYEAYDVAGRLYGVSAIADERLGGIIIWIPSSMMCLLAAIVVVHLWGLQETRIEDRRTASSPARPTTGAALVARARPGNRAIALAFCAFAFTVFTAATLVGVLHSAFSNMIRTNVVAHAERAHPPLLKNGPTL
jgi:putative membrane protein